MTNDTNKQDLTGAVMGEIEKRQVRMRPRIFFVMASVLLGIGVGGAIVAALLFVAVTTIRFQVYPPFGFLGLGRGGVRPFLVLFPWVPVLLAAVGLGVGTWLMRRYEFSYRHRFLPVVVTVVALVVAAGLLAGQAVVRANVHHSRALPFAGPPRIAEQEWVLGQIIVVGEDYFVLRAPRGEEARVVWDDTTHWRYGGEVVVGQRVRAIGEWEGDEFKATAIGNDKSRHGPGRGPGEVKGHFRGRWR